MLGENFELDRKVLNCKILIENEKPKDFLEWAQKVIWYGHRKANYLYDSEILDYKKSLSN